MATTLVVRFPWGRYHATPWGRHVNEGQVELPPAPWRLLRALYAVWRTRAPELEEEVVHGLLGRLAEPPSYLVPPYRLAHTRHYYPDTKHRTGTPSTDRTIDAFAVLAQGGELGIRWPFDLPPEERKALERLANSLPYLGRADSLCEARLDDDWAASAAHRLCGPLDIGESIPATTQVVTLLAPELPLDPAALVLRPVDVRDKKLLFPPGTRFVAYERPPEHAPARRPRSAARGPVVAARFTVIAPALPRETDAVALTDRLRSAAVRNLNQLRGHQPAHSLLVGRSATGTLDGHHHAHYLALADDDRRIAEVAVWASGGLGDDEFNALARCRRLWAPERAPGPGTVEIRLAAYGDAAVVLNDLVGPATAWRSATPFAPPRHPKQDWSSFLNQEVRRELSHRGLPEPATVDIRDDQNWRGFIRHRPSKRLAGNAAAGAASRPGALLDITFAQPVTGPILLGYLSHFGLGLFRPVAAGSP